MDLQLNGVPMRLLVDTGACVSILPIKCAKPTKKPTHNLILLNNENLKSVGCCEIDVSNLGSKEFFFFTNITGLEN